MCGFSIKLFFFNGIEAIMSDYVFFAAHDGYNVQMCGFLLEKDDLVIW